MASDPREWTVEQVAKWIRNGLPRFAEARPNARLPDLDRLCAAVQEQEVDGYALFSDLFPGFLKECGITLGRQALVIRAIKHLNDNWPTGSESALTETTRASTDEQKRARPHETVVVDEQGRKRRRLQIQGPRPSSIPVAASLSTTVPLRGHLGDQAFTANAFFFSHHLPGKAMTQISRPTNEDDEFLITSDASIRQGMQKFAAARIKHLYQSAQISTGPDGKEKSTWVLAPYPPALATPKEPRSVILFDEDDDHNPVLRQNLPEDHGEWDFLITKHQQQDDTLLPTYGHSEDESDVSSTLEREIRAEEEQKNHAQAGKLDQETVRQIVEEVIEDYTNDWHDKREARLENTARMIWKKARAAGARGKAYRAFMSAQVDHLSARLRALSQGLVEEEWTKKYDLVKQCASLQPTIQDLEEARWTVSVCKRQVAPAAKANQRPSTAQQVRASSKSPLQDTTMLDTTLPTEQMADAAEEMSMSPPDSDSDTDKESESFTPLPIDAAAQSDSDSSYAGTSPEAGSRTGGVEVPPEADTSDMKLEPAVAMVKADTSVAPDNQSVISLSSDSPGTPAKRIRQHKSRAEEASLTDMALWDWEELEADQDRKRMLSKLMSSLKRGIKDQLCDFIKPHKPADKWLQEQIIQELSTTRHVTSGPMESTSDATTLQFYLRLFACWLSCNPEPWDKKVPNDLCTHADSHSLSAWATYIVLELPRISRMMQPEEAIPILSSSEDEVRHPAKSTKKTKSRKRHEATKMKQTKALKRMLDYAMTQQASNDRSSQITDGSDDKIDRFVVNIGRAAHQPPVYLNSALAKKMKPHQVEGVQFMWREVCAEDEDDGCILAHTMGLGKTLQSIAFLVTLSEAVTNKRTRRSVPKDLWPFRALILAPPAVLLNWYNEINQWQPHQGFFKIFMLTSGNAKQDRLEILRAWEQKGGIMLIGYHMFQRLAEQKTENQAIEGESIDSSKLSLEDVKEEEASEILLETPTIVIADEAHQLKNLTTKTSIAVRKIQTRRRIGLTGTPLSNNTKEIYALIDWVAPNYLGESTDFTSRFSAPIEAGLFQDSGSAERLRSRRKLAALHKRIGPKIDRADITVLKGSIPSKTEYNIVIPLSPLQDKLYRLFVDALRRDHSGEEVTQVRLFNWLAVLVLLCNHPRAFQWKLQGQDKSCRRAPSKATVASPGDDGDGDVVEIGDEEVKKLGISESSLQTLLAAIPETVPLDTSYRMVLINHILTLAKKAKEKTLVFSHSLLTLSCMEELMTEMGVSFARIDGLVNMKKREAILDQFQSGKYDVLLISTRAGGQGLNMQIASRVIIIDFAFNPSWEDQAVGRAYRLGQQRPVYVYRFVVGGTFEDLLYNKGLFKSSLFQRIVEKKSTIRNAKRNLKEWLFSPEPVEQGEVELGAANDASILDVLLDRQQRGIDCYIRSIKTMETLHREEVEEPLNEEDQREVQAELDWLSAEHSRPSVPSSTAPLPRVDGLSQPFIPASTAPFPRVNGQNQLVSSTDTAASRRPLEQGAEGATLDALPNFLPPGVAVSRPSTPQLKNLASFAAPPGTAPARLRQAKSGSSRGLS